jgi:hypothetical protein
MFISPKQSCSTCYRAAIPSTYVLNKLADGPCLQLNLVMAVALAMQFLVTASPTIRHGPTSCLPMRAWQPSLDICSRIRRASAVYTCREELWHGESHTHNCKLENKYQANARTGS